MTYNVPMPAHTSYLKILLLLFVLQHVISVLGIRSISIGISLLAIHSPQASVRCPIVSTTASLSCWSRYGLDNRHNSPGITLNSDKEDTHCSEREREKEMENSNQPNMVLLGCACVPLTNVRDAGRQCFSDYSSHFTSSSAVCRLRQNPG